MIRVEEVKVLLSRGGAITRGDVEHLCQQIELLTAELAEVRSAAVELVERSRAYMETCQVNTSIENCDGLRAALAPFSIQEIMADNG